MLTFDRREGESVLIKLPSGQRIEIIVLDIKAGHVRIGAAVPNDVLVMREERAGVRLSSAAVYGTER